MQVTTIGLDIAKNVCSRFMASTRPRRSSFAARAARATKLITIPRNNATRGRLGMVKDLAAPVTGRSQEVDSLIDRESRPQAVADWSARSRRLLKDEPSEPPAWPPTW